MELDYGRLQAAVIDACRARGWTQAELIEKSGISRSTVQRIWRAEPTKPGRRTQRLLEQVLGWGHGAVMAVLRGETPTAAFHDPAPSQAQAQTSPAARRGLIDPNSPDSVIRELSVGPVAGGDEFREELIQLYLDDVADGERRARERAAARALRLAEKSLGPSPQDAQMLRALDRIEEIEREIEAEDNAQNPDAAGRGSGLA